MRSCVITSMHLSTFPPPHPRPSLRLFLPFSMHLPEEAGSGLNDYGLSIAPRDTLGWVVTYGGGSTCFSHPAQ